MKSNIVIIGAGQAGAMVAISLKQKNFSKSILLIGSEKHLPYQRPPLSKGFLTNNIAEESLRIKSSSYYKKNDIKILTSKTAINIDRTNKNVVLDDGQIYGYAKLVIATGSKLKRLKLNCSKENILYLRNIEDSQKIKSILNKNKSLVIVGAGYIGLEIAAAAVKKKLNVTVIEMSDRVMNRSVCNETSYFLQQKHETEGVQFIFNTSVVDIEDYNNHKRITCSDGKIIDTESIIIGIGINPDIDLAMHSGLQCENGIVVDQNGQTSDKNIFAVGDCSFHPNSIYGKHLRLESVQNAIEQARTVAAAIAGKAMPYCQVPWFWSDQYNLKLQLAGISQDHDHYLIRGEIEEESFVVYYFKNNKLIAVDAINNQKEFLQGKKLIALQRKIPNDLIEQNDFSLKNLIKDFDLST